MIGKKEHASLALKGMLKIFLLSEAAKRPVSGTEVINKIALLTKKAWKPSPGTVYPMIRELLKRKLVKKAGTSGRGIGRRQIKYEATDEGLERLKKFSSEFRDVPQKFSQVIFPLAHHMMSPQADPESAENANRAMKKFLEIRRKAMELKDEGERKKVVKEMLKAMDEFEKKNFPKSEKQK